VAVEPGLGDPLIQQDLQRVGPVAELHAARTLVRDEDVARAVAEQRQHRILVNKRHRVVLRPALARLHAADAGDGVARRQHRAPAGRQQADEAAGIDVRQLLQGEHHRHALAAGHECLEVREAFVVAVDHEHGAT
jgi:hypothetical protein